MKRTLRALIAAHNQRGQSLVELAISLTVMLLLLAGAVTFGMALFSYVAIRDAAQEGALYGSFNPCTTATCATTPVLNTPAIRQRVRAASTAPINLSDQTIVPDSYITVSSVATAPGGTTVAAKPCEGSTAIPAGGSSVYPNAIKVVVEYDYRVIMPFFGTVTGGRQTIHLRAEVTDTILAPRCPSP